MTGAILAYSTAGRELAQRMAAALGEGWALYVPQRLMAPGCALIPQPPQALYGELFRGREALIFVGACGIAVRAVAPYVRDKFTDPAVLCADEGGRYIIPLLSGHAGGANALAEALAKELRAVCVTTTGTDVQGRFSPDAWAARHGLAIAGRAEAKAVSAAILEGEVPLCSDFPLASPLPPGVAAGAAGPVGIYLTWGLGQPFGTTLRLIPKVIHLGIGCRRGASRAQIAAAAEQFLRENGIDPRAVKAAATIDLKRDEEGLLEFCREQGWPIRFYSAGELMAVLGAFPASEFVRRVTGADNVCARAAMAGAEKLIAGKTAYGGVTVAAAAEHWEADLG